MKRILLPLMAISIALVSCSRENDDNIIEPVTNTTTNPINTDLLPTSIKWGSSNIDTPIQYNGNKLTKYGNQDVEYSGDLISRIGGHYYYYNPDGTLKLSIFRSNTPIPNNATHHTYANYYTYNPDGTIRITNHLVKVSNWDWSTSQIPNNIETVYIQSETYYTIESGNVTKAIDIIYTPFYQLSNSQNIGYNNISQIYEITYEYDNKFNALKNIKGLSSLSLDHHLLHKLSEGQLQHFNPNSFKNNITKLNIKIEYRDNRTPTKILQPIEFHYEYNQQGYPTKVTPINPNNSSYTYDYIKYNNHVLNFTY